MQYADDFSSRVVDNTHSRREPVPKSMQPNYSVKHETPRMQRSLQKSQIKQHEVLPVPTAPAPRCVEGVRNMYYDYATTKAQEIEHIREVIAELVGHVVVIDSDDEL